MRVRSTGTATLIQPTIEPLYNGRSATEILSMLIDAEPQAGYNMLRAFWRDQMPNDFETAWRQTLLSGFVQNSALSDPGRKTHVHDSRHHLGGSQSRVGDPDPS